MSDYKEYGKIKEVRKTIQVSEKFRKREVILITEDKYPQELKFEFVQDNCEKADDLKAGQMATIYFNLNGREWVNGDGESKHFTSLKAWKVEPAVMGSAEPKTENPNSQDNVDSFATDFPF